MASDETCNAKLALNKGLNTITAVAADGDGEQTSTHITINEALPSHARLRAKPKFNGNAVLVKLTIAAAGSNCMGKITLSYTETVVKHHKKHKVMLVVGSQRYSISTARTATIDGSGKKLLNALGKLPVKGAVTIVGTNGHNRTAATFTLTLRPPKKHHK